ncbi:MAG: FAD-dependent oxidoreductase [Acidimicrobiia bacterium]
MNADVVIVGGGAMGSATAYHLARLDRSLSVIVVEKDPTYRYSSTLLSDGNVRIQFSLEENIRISRYAFDVLETFADEMAVGEFRPDPSPRHQGNLFLATAEDEAAARHGMERQQALGCEVEWLDADEVARRYPAYAGPGYVGGTFSQFDGSVDPNAVLHGYRRKAVSLDVEYLTGEVSRLIAGDGAMTGVELADGTRIDAPIVMNAAGAWCADLAGTVGVELPVLPVMRTVFTVETRIRDPKLPSVFLPNGLYVIPEHEGTFATAWSLPDDPVGFDFTFKRDRFESVIWPTLSKEMPAFETLHLAGGWTGLYEVNTLDANAILGEWPEMQGLWLANGFSGHGFQQCHAVGRYIAESMLGITPFLDLSRLGPERIMRNEPYAEHAGRII